MNQGGTELHRMNQGPNFLRSSFSNRDNVWAPNQFRRESKPSILKDDFSSRTDSSIFTSITPALLERSNKTSWFFPELKSTSNFLPSPQCLVDQIMQVLFCQRGPYLKWRALFWKQFDSILSVLINHFLISHISCSIDLSYVLWDIKT